MKINPNILPVMIAAVDLDGADVTELTSFLNDTLINKLEGVAGVASISTSGAIEKQINVLLSQEKIDAVNEKMQAALADQFDKADAELADAKAELENGKQELQSGHETLREEMGKAEGAKSIPAKPSWMRRMQPFPPHWNKRTSSCRNSKAKAKKWIS